MLLESKRQNKYSTSTAELLETCPLRRAYVYCKQTIAQKLVTKVADFQRPECRTIFVFYQKSIFFLVLMEVDIGEWLLEPG